MWHRRPHEHEHPAPWTAGPPPVTPMPPVIHAPRAAEAAAPKPQAA